jgi:Ca2+-binding EF-hand superfamily protein
MNKLVWFVVLALLSGMAVAEPAGGRQRNNTFDENFNRADTNHDGQLSMAEAEKNAPGIALRFALMDANHDGQLSKQELLNFVKAQRKEAASRFRRADKNGNGALSREEARALPGIYAHYDQIDANHDGEVTPQEIGRYVEGQVNKRRQARAEDKKQD